MLASFFVLNPFTMIVGGALIASPIIIHLINRMRFKRIRWAAMEFLLKAQKRSRRRMIIEQLILLLLRILMVLLIALLLSRLIEIKEAPKVKPPDSTVETLTRTVHVILLDDSASMGDRWVDDKGLIGERNASYLTADLARKAVKERIVGIVKDDKFQHDFVIMKTSQPAVFKDFSKLNDASEKQIERFLTDEYAPTLFHYDYQPALGAAKDRLETVTDANRVFYVISDFRTSDWNQASVAGYAKFFDWCKDASVQVKLIDVATPFREDKDRADKPVASSENLAITDFKPESRVALKNTPVEFTVTVTNFGESTKSNVLVRIKVNNQDRADGTVPINSVPPGQSVTARVSLLLSRTAPTNAADDERFDGFNLVSAHLDGQKTGLAIDDSRYTYVEVRDSISILLVDDNHMQDRDLAGQLTQNAESFYLYKLFTSTYRGFTVHVKTAVELEKISLQPYSAVMLCDIPQLSANALQKLDTYVQGGGGVAFFMGPSIREAKFYNEKLYNDGKGMFPAPLKEIANKDKTKQELDDLRRRDMFQLHGKLVVKGDARTHPAMIRLYSEGALQNVTDKSIRDYERSFLGISIPRYWVVNRQTWKLTNNVQPLIYTPNYASIADYEKSTKDLTAKLRSRIDENFIRASLEEKLKSAANETERSALDRRLKNLAEEIKKYEKYAPTVKKYCDAIDRTVVKYDNPLPLLVTWFDELLEGQGSPANEKDMQPEVPSMREFWALPELAELRQEFVDQNNRVKYGDPFFIAKQYGRGRVLAFMGSAGMRGADGMYWNSLNLDGKWYFPLLAKESVQRYLCSTTGEYNLTLREFFNFDLDATAYQPRAIVKFESNDTQKLEPVSQPVFTPADGRISYTFKEGAKPGLYLFEFFPQVPEGANKKDYPSEDLRALATNFDTRIESNLLRARSHELREIAKVEKVETMDIKDIPQKRIVEKVRTLPPPPEPDRDFSSSHWMFLGMIILLILEQAWSVRLSFHVRNAAGVATPGPMTRGALA